MNVSCSESSNEFGYEREMRVRDISTVSLRNTSKILRDNSSKT